MEQEIKVPSGQVVTLLDVITNAPGSDGLTERFRCLAPGIALKGGTVTAEEAGADRDLDVGHGRAVWRERPAGDAVFQCLFHHGREMRMGHVLIRDHASC